MLVPKRPKKYSVEPHSVPGIRYTYEEYEKLPMSKKIHYTLTDANDPTDANYMYTDIWWWFLSFVIIFYPMANFRADWFNPVYWMFFSAMVLPIVIALIRVQIINFYDYVKYEALDELAAEKESKAANESTETKVETKVEPTISTRVEPVLETTPKDKVKKEPEYDVSFLDLYT